jgi:hypothetical protein
MNEMFGCIFFSIQMDVDFAKFFEDEENVVCEASVKLILSVCAFGFRDCVFFCVFFSLW